MNVHTIHNSILNSCTYIISKKESTDAYLIDCGDIIPIRKYLEFNQLHLIGVFLTHGHYDHVYGLKELMLEYPDLQVCGTVEALNALSNSDRNMSYMYDIEDEYEIDPTKIIRIELSNESKITIFGNAVHCLYTPGHDIDCMSYLIGNNLFTGDAYNPEFEVYARWSTSNPVDARNNEIFLKSLVEKQKLILYPGHYKKS